MSCRELSPLKWEFKSNFHPPKNGAISYRPDDYLPMQMRHVYIPYEWYNTGCWQQPRSRGDFSDPVLNGLFRTTDPFQVSKAPKTCIRQKEKLFRQFA